MPSLGAPASENSSRFAPSLQGCRREVTRAHDIGPTTLPRRPHRSFLRVSVQQTGACGHRLEPLPLRRNDCPNAMLRLTRATRLASPTRPTRRAPGRYLLHAAKIGPHAGPPPLPPLTTPAGPPREPVRPPPLPGPLSPRARPSRARAPTPSPRPPVHPSCRLPGSPTPSARRPAPSPSTRHKPVQPRRLNYTGSLCSPPCRAAPNAVDPAATMTPAPDAAAHRHPPPAATRHRDDRAGDAPSPRPPGAHPAPPVFIATRFRGATGQTPARVRPARPSSAPLRRRPRARALDLPPTLPSPPAA